MSFPDRLRRKLTRRGGFTLTEMLVCVIILALSGMVVTMTLDLGIGQFQKQTRRSQAELLCGELSAAVQERLTYASEVTTDTDNKVTAFKTNADGLSLLSCSFAVDDNGQLQLVYKGTGAEYKYALISGGSYVTAGDSAAFAAGLDLSWENSRFTATVSVYEKRGWSAASPGEPVVGKTFTVTPVLPTSTPGT